VTDKFCMAWKAGSCWCCVSILQTVQKIRNRKAGTVLCQNNAVDHKKMKMQMQVLEVEHSNGS